MPALLAQHVVNYSFVVLMNYYFLIVDRHLYYLAA